jgi:hypothetical protein
VVLGGVLGVAVVAIAAHGGLSPSEVFVRRAVAISLFASSIAVWIRSKPRSVTPGSPPDARALFLTGAIVGGFVKLTSAVVRHVSQVIRLSPGNCNSRSRSEWSDDLCGVFTNH